MIFGIMQQLMLRRRRMLKFPLRYKTIIFNQKLAWIGYVYCVDGGMKVTNCLLPAMKEKWQTIVPYQSSITYVGNEKQFASL